MYTKYAFQTALRVEQTSDKRIGVELWKADVLLFFFSNNLSFVGKEVSKKGPRNACLKVH